MTVTLSLSVLTLPWRSTIGRIHPDDNVRDQKVSL